MLMEIMVKHPTQLASSANLNDFFSLVLYLSGVLNVLQ